MSKILNQGIYLFVYSCTRRKDHKEGSSGQHHITIFHPSL